MAVGGNVAVIGAWGDDGKGSAYVFRHNGPGWVPEEKLLASEGAAGDAFGWSVAVSGNVAVVGNPFDDDSGTNSGSAYVFRHDGSAWVQEQKLLASDGAADDRFGLSVAVSGDVAVVGAWLDDDSGTGSGSAYVFQYDGAIWVQEQKLLATDGAADDHFGISVAVSAEVAVVGADRDDDNGLTSGSAYVFRHDGSAWVQEQKLLASDGAAGDHLGFSVAASGGVAVVGANSAGNNGSPSGAAYVFRHDGSAWVQEQKLLASDGAAFDFFGWSVAVSGDVAVVGAFLHDDNAEDSGSAYVFRHNGSAWVQEQKLLPSDGATDDEFGISVAVSGDIVVGAPWDDDNGMNSGSAYLYSSPGAPGSDACQDATLITTNSYAPVSYSTVNTTVEPDELQEDCVSVFAGVSNSVWYTFAPAQSGMLTAGTAGSTYDTVLSVFAGSCSSAVQVACNDESAAGPQAELLDVPLAAGSPYLLKVSDYDSSPGGGDLDFNFSYAPVPPDLVVRVSVKFVLDADGQRPSSGFYNTDEDVINAIADANEALAKNGAGWSLELVEIVDVPNIPQWFGPTGSPIDCDLKSQMEVEAEANPCAYHWRSNAVNIYVLNDLTCGGVCSFRAFDDDILWINNLGILNGSMGWLHEIGHYFGLLHTFECFQGNCDENTCTGAGGYLTTAPSNVILPCTDSCPHTFNVMSYNSGIDLANAVLSPCQRGITTANMNLLNGPRRTVVSGVTLGITTGAGNIVVTEGGTATFGIRLTTQPGDPVTVSTSPVSGADPDISVVSGATLQFDPSNWNAFQPVTLSAALDADTVDGLAAFCCSGPGLAIAGVSAREQECSVTAPACSPGGTICNSQSATISASVPPDHTVDWFTESCGGIPVGSGTPITVSPATTTTYHARARDTSTGCVSASCCSVTVTVNPTPAAPTCGSSETICEGDSVTISASVPPGQTVDWFTESCGGTPAGSGTSITVDPATTTTYHARARDTSTGCLSASCCSVTVTVNPTPAAPVCGPDQAICLGGFVPISASVPPGQTVDWFIKSCGGTPVGAGELIFVSVTVTTSYYAQAQDTGTGCVSDGCCSITVTPIACGEYVGPDGGDWFDRANWAGGVPPNSKTDVVIPSGITVVVGEGTALAATILLEDGATLLLSHASALVQTGSITFDGATVDVAAGTLESASPILVGCSAPALLIANGTVEAPLIEICTAGEVRGHGLLVATVSDGGLLAPGSSAGALTVGGDYLQQQRGILDVELGGVAPGTEHDQLTVTGDAALDGGLAVSLIDEFSPEPAISSRSFKAVRAPSPGRSPRRNSRTAFRSSTTPAALCSRCPCLAPGTAATAKAP